MTEDRQPKNAMHSKLQDSETAYRDLFQNAPVGIFRSTSQGRLLQANPTMARLLGWDSPEEAVSYYQELGRQIYQDPESRKEFISILQEKGQVQGFEHQALCMDGQRRWLSVNARVSTYHGPWDFVLDGFVWDISPRKEQESHLQQTRRLLDEIIEFLPDATLVIDTQGRVIAWNRAIEELTGAVKEDMLGRGEYEYGRLLYGYPCPILVDIVLAEPERRPQLQKDYEYVSWSQEILYGEAYAPLVKAGQGAHLWGAAARLRDGAGNLIGAIESMRDVSERKQVEKRLQESEELYRSITENTFDLTCLLELHGNYIYYNTRYLDVLGYSSQELLGCNVLEIIHPEDQEKVAQALQQGAAEGWDQHRLSFRMRCKDGSYKWLDNRARLLKDEQRRPQVILAVGQDITERRKLEQQLQQARKMEAVGTLAGGIAHDFNNILQVINGYANILLQECAVQNSDRNKLQQILRSGQYGAELVRKLLAFSRKLEGQKRPLDLNQEVQETVQILRSTLPKMIDIQLSLEQDLWPVEADPVQMEQILLNLGSNAADAMAQGGRLEIQTRNEYLQADISRQQPELAPGSYVLLTVSDTGCGMDDQTRDKVFEPFFSTKEVGKGSGLGLASVYGIVKAHQGHVLCYSQSGQGTSFKIYLPAGSESDQEAEQVQQVQEPVPGSGTVLVVDDEPTIRDLTQEMLENMGYTVLCAASGEEALQIFQDQHQDIDVVLLDIGMPGMGGYNCMLKMLGIDPGARVLIASGYAGKLNVEQAMQAGAVGFMSKPFQMRDLGEKLVELLGRDPGSQPG
ncbi:MAG: PAS domain S-box protein [Desulfohalobiaceae bacterium]